MHTRCCEELISGRFTIIQHDSFFSLDQRRWSIDTTLVETVPAIVEVRFDCPSNPGSGNVTVTNGVWNGSETLEGNAITAITSALVTTTRNLGVLPGFTVQYPGGIGRSFTIHNRLNQEMINGFVSIRKLVSLQTESAEIKSAFARK